MTDGSYRIISQPPIVVPVRELAATYGMSPDEAEHVSGRGGGRELGGGGVPDDSPACTGLRHKGRMRLL